MRRLMICGAGLLALGLAACSDDGDADGRLASVFTLALGDCLNDGHRIEAEDPDAASEVQSMRKLDCAQPHQYEVYHVHRMDEVRRPDEAAMDLLAGTVCKSKFNSFVGRAYDDSVLDYYTLWPTAVGWEDENDREIVCMIAHADGEMLVGSRRGSGR